MDITWYGHSCFRISERNFGSVVTDPYDPIAIGYEPLKLKADIVTVSTDKPGHNYLSAVKSDPFVITRPGEYEINNIFITGHPTAKKGETRNTIFVIEVNGVFIAHLGNIDRPLTQNEVEELGTVNVLMVPCGGGASLNASQAVETVRMVQPNYVIPMHYSVPRTLPQLDPVSRFLKEMGLTQVDETYTTFKVPAMPKAEDAVDTKVILMNHPLGNEEPEGDDAADTTEEENAA